MIIRRDQIRAFEAYMRAAFEDRMVAHMRAHYPERYGALSRGGEDETGARDLVRLAVEKATRIGARREGSIQQLLEIMLETRPDFDEDIAMAWARAILDDDTMGGGTRIQLVHQKLRARSAPDTPDRTAGGRKA